MPIHSVDAKTLKNWLDKEEAVLVDVREPAEHQEHNIACATLIPLATVTKKSLPEFKGKKLVVHCLGGKRSMSACEKLVKEDPSLELYNLEGGINAWTQVCGK